MNKKKMSVWFPNTSLNVILTVSSSFNRTWKRRERKFDLLGFGAIKGAYLVDSRERQQSKDTKVVWESPDHEELGWGLPCGLKEGCRPSRLAGKSRAGWLESFYMAGMGHGALGKCNMYFHCNLRNDSRKFVWAHRGLRPKDSLGPQQKLFK